MNSEEIDQMPKWLNDAVFYQIYPQSFKDSNQDGIGDINGIIDKLDYIKDLGCNALWINPCFESPFKDAGYDVKDYKKIAPRYGSNTDMYRLFGEAHNREMHVLLDLVPGHTSEEHPWFKESKKAETNPFSNRYIWTDSCFHGPDDMPFVAGESQRNGCYILNFFKCQPALNYGFLHPTEKWQLPMDHPDCIATREAMKDVMRFWLDHGCDGFRVDMANSLVKGDDENKTGTVSIWREVREMLDRDYPDATMISEWNNPPQAIAAGFHSDFCLHMDGNGYSTLFRDYKNHEETERKAGGVDHSFFKKDGHGDITRFLADYLPWYEAVKGKGYMSLTTGNHDTERMSYTMSEDELKIAYAFILTMPGVPFLYYGDEIGLRYQELPSWEGGYNRTGSRTPMQWTEGKNKGFSEGSEDTLYLPLDPSSDAPTVETQKKLPGSLFNTVRDLIRLRHETADLQAAGEFEVLYAEKGKFPFVYRRGSLTVAVNPSEEQAPLPKQAQNKEIIYSVGKTDAYQKEGKMAPQSFLVLK